MIPECDKCGGIEFDQRRKEPPPLPVRQKATVYFAEIDREHAVFGIRLPVEWVATCLQCGTQYSYIVSA